jgi:redox-sensitive bicupin YhaK (pirin superfamily)
MKAAGYRDIPASAIPVVDLPGGGRVKVIAGTLELDGRAIPGPMQGSTTEPLYFDVELPAGASFTHPVKSDHNAFVYVYEGGLEVGPAGAARPLETHNAGVLTAGDRIEVRATGEGARFILLAGRPLREPVVQYGPFVMNTREEIEQAVRDYQSGVLTQS